MATPRVLVIRAPGTNCDVETVRAWELAGASAETWPIAAILDRRDALDQFQVLTIPGGFAYGDDLGAGKVFAARLMSGLGDRLRRFAERDGFILGICNGFQVLVKTGLLPGDPSIRATLTQNASGHFEARWVRLCLANARRSAMGPWLDGFGPDGLELPMAHAEGRFLTADETQLDRLERQGQVALAYADEHGRPTTDFPANPNGSPRGVAAVSDPGGRIFGLMPHPERFVDPMHHPRWTRQAADREPDGLRFFRNAVRALAS